MQELELCPKCMSQNKSGAKTCPVCGCSMQLNNDAHQLPVNTILEGRYLVGACIGEGGFGITYIGYDLRLDVKVAIKEYYPTGNVTRFSAGSLSVHVVKSTGREAYLDGTEKFLSEARALAKFTDDSNIVQVKDFFMANGTAYIVMEYLDGESLQQFIKREGPQSVEKAFKILEPIMYALEDVHKHNLIHRDISPSNIMLLKDGQVKLLDFGTSRLFNSDGNVSLSIVLKPGFAPVEQYRTHGAQGPWTDVYALSATFYKLITGKTPENAMDRLENDGIVPPSAMGVKITPKQEKILMQGLAIRHQDRIQTVKVLRTALAETLNKNAASPQDKPHTSSEKHAKPAPKVSSGGKKDKIKPYLKYIIPAIAAAAVIGIIIGVARPFAKKDAVSPPQNGNTAEDTLSPEGAAADNAADKYLLVSSMTFSDGEFRRTESFLYNKYGQMTGRYYRDSSLAFIENSSYDKSGDISSATKYFIAPYVTKESASQEYTEYKNDYDKYGRLSSTEKKWNGTVQNEYYEYDSKGNILHIKSTDENNDTYLQSLFYDKYDRLVERRYYKNRTATAKAVYQYDGDVLVGRQFYNENGDLTQIDTIENNEFGCPIKESIIVYDGSSAENVVYEESTEKKYAAFDVSSGIPDYPEKFEYNGHHYLLLPGFLTMEDAELYCNSIGGYLAVISSQEENDAIYNYIISSGHGDSIVFFGCTDRVDQISPDGKWHWVAGEESNFGNFRESQPDGGDNENYACMYSAETNGQWDDCAFFLGSYVICEWSY